MRHFLTVTAATAAFVALLASVPAKADYNYGPTQNAGQCWKPAMFHGRDGFGSWGACAKPASAVTTRVASRHHRR